jgi:hypothetical protein
MTAVQPPRSRSRRTPGQPRPPAPASGTAVPARVTRAAAPADRGPVSAASASVRADHWPVTGRAVALVLGTSGWAFACVLWIVGWQIGKFGPSWDVSEIFLPAGRAFWAGANPYTSGAAAVGLPFMYAPPWAALFGLLAPFGPGLVNIGIVALEFLSLRYIAGSWLRAGAFCWFFLVPWELVSGQLNLIAAAAIVAAVRGRPTLAAIVGLAKLSPVLAVHPRDWRPFLVAAGLFALISLPDPMAWLWWIERLVANLAVPAGPLVPIPLILRLPVGLAFVAWGRPWSRALGACIATPGLYWGALVVFVAPLGVMLRGRDPAGGVGRAAPGADRGDG